MAFRGCGRLRSRCKSGWEARRDRRYRVVVRSGAPRVRVGSCPTLALDRDSGSLVPHLYCTLLGDQLDGLQSLLSFAEVEARLLRSTDHVLRLDAVPEILRTRQQTPGHVVIVLVCNILALLE